MKVKNWMRLGVINKFVLGKKCLVHVKMPYGKTELHAYELNAKNRLLVHKTEEQEMYNPIVQGKPTYFEDGRLMFTWVYGEPHAKPLFSNKSFEEKIQSDEVAEQSYNAGLVVGELRARGKGRKTPFNDPVFLALIAVILFLAINIILTYMGLTSLGAEFLGATPNAGPPPMG